MEKIAIIGVGGFGREVKMLIDQINKVENKYEIIGFFDDKIYTEKINGMSYLGSIDQINNLESEVALVLAVGNPKTKKKIIAKISNPEKFHFPNLIHPNAVIGDDSVFLGKGNIICAGCIITCNINIKDFVILNLMCTVGHDTNIDSFSSFMPSVNISGEVIIHEEVYVGTGAKIINQLEIGKGAIIGAGAVVSKTIPENCTAVGIPAKPIKFHE